MPSVNDTPKASAGVRISADEIGTEQTVGMFRGEVLPAWAVGVTYRDFSRLRKLITNEVRRRSGSMEDFTDGSVTIGEVECSLETPLRLATLTPKAAWGDMLRAYFDSILTPPPDLPTLAFADIAPRLRVRLFDGLDDALEALLVRRELTKGLTAALVYDAPTAIVNVRPADMLVWNEDHDALWDRAVQQSIGGPASWDRATLPGDVDVRITGTEDDYFVTTRALALDAQLGRAPHGFIVGIPHRHALVVLPIVTTHEVFHAMKTLPVLVRDMSRQYPHPVSESLFWVRDGAFERIGIEVTDPQPTGSGKLAIAPGPGFEALLASLVE